MVELLPRRQDIVRRAFGQGVAGEEPRRGVGVAQGIGNAQALRLLPVEPSRHGHHVVHDGLTELLHVRLGIAVALHAVVPQGHVVFIAQGPAHFGPEGGELVVDVVQLLLVLRIEARLGQPRLPPQLRVWALLVGPQLGNGQHLALEWDLGGGDELCVGGGELVLLLHVGDELGIEGAQLDLHVGEQERTVFLLELRPPGGAEQHQLGPLLQFLQLRHGLVQVFLLRGVELVLRVHGMADITQSHRGLYPGEHLFDVFEDLIRLGEALRALERLHEFADPFPEKVHIRPNIGHVRKQHDSSSSIE